MSTNLNLPGLGRKTVIDIDPHVLPQVHYRHAKRRPKRLSPGRENKNGTGIAFPNFPPTIALCGWSGSGKTWLLERLLPRLEERGLRTLVVKHDAHRLNIDHPGKDSDRLFQAGAAALIAHDSEQILLRARLTESPDSSVPIASLAASFDLILLEGHKHAPLSQNMA